MVREQRRDITGVMKMSCTHPVIYRNGDGIPVCFVCGAILKTTEETTAKEEKPTKKSKKTKAD